MLEKNHYKALGLKPGASGQEIKKRFRYLVLKGGYHPDKVSEDQKEQAAEKFKIIREVYEVLMDESKRREYDSRMGFDKLVDEEHEEGYTEKIYAEYEELHKIILVYNEDEIFNVDIGNVIEKYLSELGIYEYFEEHYHNTSYYDLDVSVLEPDIEMEMASLIFDFEDFAKKYGMDLMKLSYRMYLVKSLGNFKQVGMSENEPPIKT